MNPRDCPWTSLSNGVHSPIIQFLLKIQKAKISAHPYDGYGVPSGFVFEGQAAHDGASAIRILMSYIQAVNKTLRTAKPHAKVISGVVLGEGLGCPPFRNDEATSNLYREIINETFDDTFTIGGSNGTIYIEQRYYQMYDWTEYDPKNPNPWAQSKDSPAELLEYFVQMREAWDGEARLMHQQDPANFYGEPGAWHDKNGMFWWETGNHLTPGVDFHWMFALSSQTGLNDRLARWQLSKVKLLFSLIRGQIRNAHKKAGIALYNNGQPLPSHWLTSGNFPPENPGAKGQKIVSKTEPKPKPKPESEQKPKQKPQHEEEYVGAYDKNHVIYFRRSTGRFFAKKHGNLLSEDETSIMMSNMEASNPGFKEELKKFKEKEGL